MTCRGYHNLYSKFDNENIQSHCRNGHNASDTNGHLIVVYKLRQAKLTF